MKPNQICYKLTVAEQVCNNYHSRKVESFQVSSEKKSLWSILLTT